MNAVRSWTTVTTHLLRALMRWEETTALPVPAFLATREMESVVPVRITKETAHMPAFFSHGIMALFCSRCVHLQMLMSVNWSWMPALTMLIA